MTRFLLNFFSFTWLNRLDFLAPLFLRLYLAPVFWVLGNQKIDLDVLEFTIQVKESYVNPFSKAFLGMDSNFWIISIGLTEMIAGVLLLIGFFVRWVSLPLMVIVMFGLVMTVQSFAVLEKFVMEHGNLQVDQFEILLMQFIMLVALFFLGAGRYISFDWFIQNTYTKKVAKQVPEQPKQEEKIEPEVVLEKV